jgi:NAD(P)-dependent dehydrogenase (short-subunit alcohol dehydrogenase family)
MAENGPSIFITGAGAGIGRATARLFAERGFVVGLFDVDERALEETASGMDSSRVVKRRLDVTDESSFAGAMGAFGDATGGTLDVMFNCAGILRTGKFEEVSMADNDAQIAVNLRGVILGTRLALPLLLKGGMRRIISMSSASAIYGVPDLAVYSATKFAVRALTEALDLELRPRGVRVCDLMPGYVNTNMVSSLPFKPASIKTLGVRHTAEDVARRVWDAAHGDDVHYFLATDVAALARVANLVPRLGRYAMKLYAKK